MVVINHRNIPWGPRCAQKQRRAMSQAWLEGENSERDKDGARWPLRWQERGASCDWCRRGRELLAVAKGGWWSDRLHGHAQVGLGTTDRWAPSLFYFQNQNQDPNLKFRRELFPASKIHEKIWSDRGDQGEQLIVWVKLQNQNRFWITNLESF
jgi:hypothetical protein